jgi:hypothetical protein
MRFEVPRDNHRRLVCPVCDDVADIDCVVRPAHCPVPGHAAGYLLHEADVTSRVPARRPGKPSKPKGTA